MRWIKVSLWILRKRLRSSMSLVAVSCFGILSSTTLLSSGIIYSHSLAEGGLRHTLAFESPKSLDFQLVVQNRPLGLTDYLGLRDNVENLTDKHLPTLLGDPQRSGHVRSELPLAKTVDEPARSLPIYLGQPMFRTNFEKHTELLSGTWPEKSQTYDQTSLNIEVLVGMETAYEMGWDVGSMAYLIPPKADGLEKIALEIVGLVEPTDIDEEYWGMSGRYYFSTQSQDPHIIVPFYLTENSFFEELGSRYPFLIGDYWWFFPLNTSLLTADNVSSTKEAAIALETNLNKVYPRSLVFSILGEILSGFQRELLLAQLPIFIFLSLVMLVVLYFLALVLGFLSSARGDEISLLRSRGASITQITFLLSMTEVLVVLMSIVLGPIIGLAITRHLLLHTIEPAGNVGDISTTLSADVFAIAAISGLLSLLVVIVSNLSMSRLSMAQLLNAKTRPPTKPFVQRYYIDLLALAIIGLTWWQIDSRQGFIEMNLEGTAIQQAHPTLLLWPALIILGASLMIVRILPMLAKLLTKTINNIVPVWAALTINRIARDPLPHASLIVILMISTVLGVFGATFQSTLAKSQQDQTLYKIGGELVLGGQYFPASTKRALYSIPGVTAVSFFHRNLGPIIGIDPETLPDISWFREDFAETDLRTLLEPLISPGFDPSGIYIPPDATSVGVWTRMDNDATHLTRPKLSIWIRLSDDHGEYHNFLLKNSPDQNAGNNNPSLNNWTYLETSLHRESGKKQQRLRLVAFYMTGSISGYQRTILPGTIDFDDLTITSNTTSLEPTVIQGFEKTEEISTKWVPLPNSDSDLDLVMVNANAARNGNFGLSFSWQDALGTTPRGILSPNGPFPLPSIGTATFKTGQQVFIDSNEQTVPLIIAGTTNYFPGISPSTPPYFLVNLTDYNRLIRQLPGLGIAKPPKEFWVSLANYPSRDITIHHIKDQLPRLASIQNRQAELDLAKRDPLAGGSWIGLTALSISTLIITVTIALVVFSLVSIRARRVDLAVTEALGLSKYQIILTIMTERIIELSIGISIGITLGTWLSHRILGFLAITADGSAVVPPMIITTHMGLVVILVLGILVALGSSTLFTTIWIRNLRAPDILRSGL